MTVQPVSPRWALLGTMVALVGLLAAPKERHGEPYTPTSTEVVGRSQAVVVAADDLETATRQARALIVASRQAGGDPRLLGRAQAVLSRWWGTDDLPTETRLVRATIRQSLHEFTLALADLDAIVAADPGDAQAWLTRATVLQVVGRLDEAAASCRRLSGTVFTVCQAQVDGLRGEPAKAREALTKALSMATADELAWARSVLGDVALWAGDPDGALESYQHALRLDPSDEYTRGALADLLLDLGRARAVIELLRGHTTVDAQLLRLTIAAHQTHDAQESVWRRELAERIEAGRARQDVVHRREEARYVLALEGDAERALTLAEANFAVQKEPADARVLLEAAAAAQQPSRARPALDWLATTGFSDPTLRRLARQVAP